MATVSYTIYSHHDPKQREQDREILAGQPLDGLNTSTHDPWQTESSFPTFRLLDKAPRFVPATISFDEWGAESGSYQSLADNGGDETRHNSAQWYRSLISGRGATNPSTRPSNPPNPTSSKASQKTSEARNKNNWFILRAIRSEPPSTSSTPPVTLADILDRDPPPLPSEQAYKPPVWLALGPSNKGFTMLEQSGWNEGEGLGAHISRRPARSRPDGDFMALEGESVKKRAMLEGPSIAVEQEKREVRWDDDVQEVRHVNVIDLTISDSEESEEEDVPERAANGENIPIEDHAPDAAITTFVPAQESHSRYSPKALLTPIPTVLKSDRLGIGRKAKTVGPYKASQKRVTHNAAALAAHIKAAEETCKKKAETGRGHRGFAKAAKKEREARQKMLAYLNG